VGALTLTAVGLLLPIACSSNAKLPPNVLQAGQIEIQLPPGWKVTHDGVVAPAQAQSGSLAVTAGATTTIPLAKQNPTTEFFQATSAFSSCLKGLGVKFIGAPNPADPSSPSNDPSYLKSLETCAAQSHIVQALKDFQAAQDKLTPQQIQQENKDYLRWRTCMIGRGWQVPKPVPDSQGRLFSLGSSGANGPQLVPPAGQSVLDSPDIQDCVKQSQLGGPGSQG
jgi:hypothetical protein